jgi:hypothetical protein
VPVSVLLLVSPGPEVTSTGVVVAVVSPAVGSPPVLDVGASTVASTVDPDEVVTMPVPVVVGAAVSVVASSPQPATIITARETPRGQVAADIAILMIFISSIGRTK